MKSIKQYNLRRYSATITGGRDLMKYATEMVSGGKIYIPSFIKIGSGIQKSLWGHTYTDTQTAR
jgi:hypothetical protein